MERPDTVSELSGLRRWPLVGNMIRTTLSHCLSRLLTRLFAGWRFAYCFTELPYSAQRVLSSLHPSIKAGTINTIALGSLSPFDKQTDSSRLNPSQMAFVRRFDLEFERDFIGKLNCIPGGAVVARYETLDGEDECLNLWSFAGKARAVAAGEDVHDGVPSCDVLLMEPVYLRPTSVEEGVTVHGRCTVGLYWFPSDMGTIYAVRGPTGAFRVYSAPLPGPDDEITNTLPVDVRNPLY